MANKVSRVRVCDLCGSEDVARYTVVYPEGARTYDLCVTHAAPLCRLRERAPAPPRRSTAQRMPVALSKVKKARGR